jgi:hypothetical protein
MNLTNPFASVIAQAAQQEGDTETLKQYAQRLNPKKASGSLLLLDISGSMSETIENGIRKIDILRQALNRPLHPGEQAIAFNSAWYPLLSLQAIPEPSGSTALHYAIQEVATTYKPATTLVVCDGRPDSPEQALEAIRKLSGVINTLYIGPDNDQAAIDFMRKLARAGCGRAHCCDLRRNAAPQLSSAIAGLLPPSQA